MKPVDIAFVILQYKASEETIACVDSIRRHIDTENYSIIIVDNASPDDSYKIISDAFAKSSDIVLLHTDSNLGFANGNNVGFQYAVKNLKPEFIVMLNNDIILFQDGLYARLKEKFDTYRFAVMGPMIISKDGSYTSNPTSFSNTYRSKEATTKLIKKANAKLLMERLRLLNFASKIYHSNSSGSSSDTSRFLDDAQNVCLHGSFLVFSSVYQASFPLGLDGRTFMYDEESLLHLHILQAGLSSLYSSCYAVYHKEDASTNQTFKGNHKKNIFVLENNIKSKHQYLEVLKEYEN